MPGLPGINYTSMCKIVRNAVYTYCCNVLMEKHCILSADSPKWCDLISAVS